MSEVLTAIKHALRYRIAKARPPRARDLSQGPIRLYWWNDKVNFGDVLNPLIVTFLTGREVTWASLESADLYGIGSVYGWVRQNTGNYGREIHIWGAGIKKPGEATGHADLLHHHLVRGPLTAIAAEDDTLPQGDPGLLAPEACGVARAADARGIGIIPHRSQWSRPEYIAELAALPGVRMIDYRTEDCTAILQEMASCERIYSTSLHGLIVADALGIPNYHFQGRRFAGLGHDYKFFDYALSVGRDLTRPVDLETHLGTAPKPQDTAYLANIPGVKAAIAGSFPYDVFGGDRTIAEGLVKALTA